MDHYSFQRLMSIGLLSLEVYQPRTINKFYPHNMAIAFKHLSNHVKTEICTPAFNRMAKIHFKYKCPHRQGKNNNQCVQCIEIHRTRHRCKKALLNAVIKTHEYSFSLLQHMHFEGTGAWFDDFQSYSKLLSDRILLIFREVIKGNIKL